jgi:hypothetical protein
MWAQDLKLAREEQADYGRGQQVSTSFPGAPPLEPLLLQRNIHLTEW